MTTNSHATAATEVSPVATVTGLALGYLVSRALHVATELGVADQLADGPRSASELAAATGAHADSLARVLRTLAAHGVFSEQPDGRFTLTPAAALLQSGVMRDGILLCGEVAGDGSWWNAVGALRHSVTTGESAWEHVHGQAFFDYVTARPACGAYFDRAMANFASAENPAVAAAYDFGQFDTLVDVGGGQGGLLAEVLTRHARVQGVLFDLPAVVSNPAALAAAPLAGRWRASAGDFFQAAPAADGYVLKRILHDWGDEECVRILRTCRAAMAPHARLLVADAVLPAGDVFHPAKVMDVLMMVFGTGRERSEAQFRALFARAGLRLTSVTATASTLAIVEGVPV